MAKLSSLPSIGPMEKLLMNGDVTEAELLAAIYRASAGARQRRRARSRRGNHAGLGRGAHRHRRRQATGLPVVASMVFDSGKDKDRTMMGTTPEQAAAALVAAGADVVGANCGQGIAGFVKICARLKSAAGGHPIWIKANAGLPQMKDGKAIYAMTAAEFAGYVPAVLAAGANFIGGCCGTSPEFIREVHQQLHAK